MTFNEKLNKAVEAAGSPLCVGLDPSIDQIPDYAVTSTLSRAGKVEEFCNNIINATYKQAAAYKPNLAFFEYLGSEGLAVFERVLKAIPQDRIIIADAKRGDIGHTASHYAKAYFEIFNVDAITLNPLMGFDTLHPYLDDSQRAVFVLTSTSNDGASDFFDHPFAGFNSMGAYIANRLNVLQDSSKTHCGMVIGATRPRKLSEIIKWNPEANLLIPGVGTQGGSVAELKNALADHKGIPIVSVSRSILYASEGLLNYKDYFKVVKNQAVHYNQSLKHLISEQGYVKT